MKIADIHRFLIGGVLLLSVNAQSTARGALGCTGVGNDMRRWFTGYDTLNDCFFYLGCMFSYFQLIC